MVAGAVSSSALPGAPAWDVIVGDRFIAAVGAPAPADLLAALAEAAGARDLSVERLVGLFPVGRSNPIGSFAVVWWPPGEWSHVTAVVRGDAVIDLESPGGSRRFDARSTRPWLLAEFRAVAAVRLTGVESPLEPIGAGGEVIPHARASVRASSIEWSAPSGAALARTPSATPAPSAETEIKAATESETSARDDHAGPPLDALAAADTVLLRRHHVEADAGPGVPASQIEADTILTPRANRRGVVGPPPAFAEELDGVAPARRLSAPASGPARTPQGWADAAASVDLGRPSAARPPVTAARPDLDAAVARLMPPPTAPTPTTAQEIAPPPEIATTGASAPPSTGPRFRIGTGPEHVVTAPVLIGRRPAPRRVSGVAGAAPELLAVDSPRSVVSSTHLELRLEGTRLVATDLRSTNGTTVRTAGGARRMRAGESIVVAPGSTLDLGDDTIIEILPAPGTSIE